MLPIEAEMGANAPVTMVQRLISYFQGSVPGCDAPPPSVVAPSNSFGNIQTKAARTLMGESSGAPFQEARQVSGSPPDPEKHMLAQGGSFSRAYLKEVPAPPETVLIGICTLPGDSARAERSEASKAYINTTEANISKRVTPSTAPTQYSTSGPLKWNKTSKRSEASLQVLFFFFFLYL